jgi:hypothetical protein
MSWTFVFDLGRDNVGRASLLPSRIPVRILAIVGTGRSFTLFRVHNNGAENYGVQNCSRQTRRVESLIR